MSFDARVLGTCGAMMLIGGLTWVSHRWTQAMHRLDQQIDQIIDEMRR